MQYPYLFDLISKEFFIDDQNYDQNNIIGRTKCLIKTILFTYLKQLGVNFARLSSLYPFDYGIYCPACNITPYSDTFAQYIDYEDFRLIMPSSATFHSGLASHRSEHEGNDFKERIFHVPAGLDQRGVRIDLVKMGIESTFVASIAGSISESPEYEEDRRMIYTHSCVIESIKESYPVPPGKTTSSPTGEPLSMDIPYTGYSISINFGKIFIPKDIGKGVWY